MKFFKTCLAMGASLWLALACQGAGQIERPGWKLTFQDEFEGSALDLQKWNPNDPWGRERNLELQAYVKDAFVVTNGILRIQAEKREAIKLPLRPLRRSIPPRSCFMRLIATSELRHIRLIHQMHNATM